MRGRRTFCSKVYSGGADSHTAIFQALDEAQERNAILQ
jgi:hypothetical protein